MRRSIILIATAGILPIIALGGAFGVTTLRSQQATVRTGAVAMTRFVGTLASVKLGDGMREMNMVAQSQAFDGPLDRQRFAVLAARLRGTTTTWRFFSVADPSGRRLMDVPEPIGGVPGGRVIDMVSLRRAVETRKPVIGDVITGPRGDHAFAVRAPVIRDGQVRYVVSAIIPPEAIVPLLRFRELPEGWRAGILDGSGTVIADARGDPSVVGRRGSAEGRLAKRSGNMGPYEVTRQDGTKAMAYWAPITGTNWTVHVSTPAAAYLGPARTALTLLIAVVLLCLVLLAVFTRLLVVELRQFREHERADVQRQRMEALGRLTGGVAHDLNNLLTPVLGGLDLLRRRIQDDEKAQRYVSMALAGAERSRSLVDRLLSFSRRQALVVTAVDLGRLLAGLEDLLVRSVGPSVAVRLDLPRDLPLARCDPGQLELAVLNLAINARDAMPDGGAVAISAEAIEVKKASDLAAGRYVAISIADTGMGMDEATLRHAIEPFFTTKAADKGTGLGLSMVHGLAAQCGGALRLRSKPGVGTTATIVIPQAEGNPPAPAEAGEEQALGEGRLLLVDDDDAVRAATAEMLCDGGFSVVEATSVDEALEILAADATIKAVVTDHIMPERSGADLIRALAATRPALPVLLISGYEPQEQDEPLPADVQRLAKPFRADEIVARVKRLLAGEGAQVG
ncbi:MAG: response regulator [Sphingobium sp.]|nr:response regulator [Sphingobium sp.]